MVRRSRRRTPIEHRLDRCGSGVGGGGIGAGECEGVVVADAATEYSSVLTRKATIFRPTSPLTARRAESFWPTASKSARPSS
jgi:hypothetical protein